MKIKVLFLKKKHIIYFLLFIAVLVTFTIIKKHKTVSSFNIINTKRVLKKDLTGDGQKDSVDISISNHKYNINIKSKNNNHELLDNKNDKFIGDSNKFWPLNLNFIDISRDKVPEIFIQCSKYKLPAQYVYFWENNKFTKLYSSNNNILGIIDYNNNKTPKVISGNLKNNKIFYDSFIFIENKLKRFDYNFQESFMGSNTILNLIDYIHGLPTTEENKPKDIFDKSMKENSFESIGTLCSKNNIYTFEDGSFKDIKTDNNGNITEVQWDLNFKGISKADNNSDDIGNYNLSVFLKLDNNSDETYKFKIYSIKLN